MTAGGSVSISSQPLVAIGPIYRGRSAQKEHKYYPQNLRLSTLRSMDHYPLVLLALWSVVLLQFAQKTGSQSGEAASGAGGTTYENVLERGRNATDGSPELEGIVRPGSNRTTSSSFVGSFCSLYVHELTLEYKGCVTNYPTISCAGRCHSEQRPNQFLER